MSALSRMLREIELVLAPLLCAGCGADDVELCAACESRLHGALIAVPEQDFPVWAQSLYIGATRNIIARWKDHGRNGLNPILERCAQHSANELAAALSAETGIARDQIAQSVLIVPMPSSKAATKERGFVPSEIIAQGLATGLSLLKHESQSRMGTTEVGAAPVAERGSCEGRGMSVDCTPNTPNAEPRLFLQGLIFRRRKRDQSNLNAAHRRRNLLGSILAHPDLKRAASSARIVVLVDDVVTTGATLAEARRAIRPASGTFVAGYSLVMTPKSALTAESRNFVDETPRSK